MTFHTSQIDNRVSPSFTMSLLWYDLPAQRNKMVFWQLDQESEDRHLKLLQVGLGEPGLSGGMWRLEAPHPVPCWATSSAIRSAHDVGW